jgi:hypothetical protein
MIVDLPCDAVVLIRDLNKLVKLCWEYVHIRKCKVSR